MGSIRNGVDVDALFRRLYPTLFRYLHRQIGDEDAAADIAQEAFVRLLRHPLPEEDARPWLFRVAGNLLRDRARQKKRRGRLEPVVRDRTAPSRPAPADEAAERRERIHAVRGALNALNERDRGMLLMREEGFTYREIAEVAGVAPASVGKLLARALKRFREIYLNEAEHAAHG